MKKIILIIVLAVASLTANAEHVVYKRVATTEVKADNTFHSAFVLVEFDTDINGKAYNVTNYYAFGTSAWRLFDAHLSQTHDGYYYFISDGEYYYFKI